LQVYRDRVIVDIAGTQQPLRLPQRYDPSQFVAALQAPAEDGVAAPDTLESPGFQLKAELGVLPIAAGAVHVLRPEAVVEDGQLRGYQVFPNDPDKLGVNSGDELVAINDKQFHNPNDAAQVIGGLDSSSAANVKLTLVHDGQRYDVVVDSAA